MENNRVRTVSGIVRGTWGSDPRVLAFRGIPYAKPPVGELRWQMPQAPDFWEGDLDCIEYRPMAMQDQPGTDPEEFWTDEIHPTGSEFKRSEDCLYLNVFTPARSEDEALPVLFYIHGGGYQGGYSYEIEFDWEHTARKGMVVVSVGYRLGIMGFFAHPGLIDKDGGFGNYGIADLYMALCWVRDNIRAFGGDPGRITIAGQSAGSGAVQILMAMQKTRGLIAGAICESGASLGFGDLAGHERGREFALKQGEEFLEKAGLTLEQAKALPWEELRRLEKEILGSAFHFTPVTGGNYIPDAVDEMWLRDRMPRIPILCGYNSDELVLLTRMFHSMPGTLEELDRFADRYGDKKEEFLSLCGCVRDEDVDALFDCQAFTGAAGARRFADAVSAQGRCCYFYEFMEKVPGKDNAGAYHGAEMWFAYDSLARCHRPFTGVHYDLARRVSSYWANFIKTGNPNGTDIFGNPLPQWKPYTPEDPFRLGIRQDMTVSEKMSEKEERIYEFRNRFADERRKG